MENSHKKFVERIVKYQDNLNNVKTYIKEQYNIDIEDNNDGILYINTDTNNFNEIKEYVYETLGEDFILVNGK